MNNRDKKLPHSVIIMSFLVALFADIKCINWSMTYGFFQGRGSGFMSLLYPITFFLILAVFVFYKYKIHQSFSNISIFLIVYLFFFYLVTLWFIGSPRVTILQFSAIVLLGLIIPNITCVDSRIVLKAVMFYPTFAILRLSSIFFMAYSWKDYISMDASYAFLTPIIATIVYLFMYFKQESKKQKLITIFLSLVNFIFFIKLLQYGARGPILSILLLLLFMWVVKPKVNSRGVLINSIRSIITIVSFIVILFAFKPIIFLLNSAFRSLGYNIYIFEKILSLGEEKNLTNGRDIINDITLSWIRERPILGFGLDRFEANTGLSYPHNFILQILFDGGLVFFMILLFPIGQRLIKKFKNCSKNEYVMLSFLFFTSVPYALLSQNMWNNAGLWLFFGAVLSKSFFYNTPKN